MGANQLKIAGIVPAAGQASRLSPIPCSKELLPISIHEGKEPGIKVAAAHLLESYSVAGADQIYMVIRKGKWDIPQYFGVGVSPQSSLAYIATDATRGTHQTIDLAYPFVKDCLVLLGFPDILFQPLDAFSRLLDKQEESHADMVLGLFKATNPLAADMVELNAEGRIKKFVIKPEATSLEYTWIIAVWTPSFTHYLHDYVVAESKAKHPKSGKLKEIYIGDVIQEAMQQGLSIEHVLFPNGHYVDIGTVPNFKKILSCGL